MFNWLQPYIRQSCCLDAFAGSGVLGFEALSRGADEVVFIEQNIKTVKCLKDNASMLKASKALIYHTDVMSWLLPEQVKNRMDQTFDLVFLDPPFHLDLLAQCSRLLNSSGCLAEDAIIYVEHAVDEKIVLPDNWTCMKEKTAGQVSYKLFES